MTEEAPKINKKPLQGDTKELYNQLVKSLDQKINRLRPQDAQSWYKERIRSAITDRSRRLARNIPKHGELVTFLYDPKTKDTLPYYDQFPLSFVLEQYADGFLGLSMHYLRPRDRLALYKRFLRLATDPTIKDSTRLRLTYQAIRDERDFVIAKTCIKRYLYTNMLTVPTLVPATQWELTLGLPVAMFAKASADQVYAAESKKRAK